MKYCNSLLLWIKHSGTHIKNCHQTLIKRTVNGIIPIMECFQAILHTNQFKIRLKRLLVSAVSAAFYSGEDLLHEVSMGRIENLVAVAFKTIFLYDLVTHFHINIALFMIFFVWAWCLLCSKKLFSTKIKIYLFIIPYGKVYLFQNLPPKHL